MTTVALRERWTFRGVDLSTYAVVALSPDVDAFPALRGEDAPRSGLWGRHHLGKLFDSRRVSLIFYVFGRDAAGSDTGASATVARTNLDALYATLGLRTQGALVRLMPDGTSRTAQAECVAVSDVSDGGTNHSAYVFTASFELADPLFYGASSTGPGSQTFSATPKDFTFTAGGTTPTRKLTVDFTGPVTNPRITNLTTGEFVNVAQAVTSGQHLIIDPYLYTVTDNGVSVIGDLTHGASVAWLTLVPGANSLRATASVAGGSILVTAFPAYL